MYSDYSPYPAFFARLVLDGDCWIWTARTSNGYGWFQDGPFSMYAHRFSCAAFNGLRQDEFCLHACDTPLCVNPRHLRAGTQADNMQDVSLRGRWNNQMVGRTHCSRGHEYTAASTAIRYHRGRPYRSCRKCERENAERQRRASGVGPGRPRKEVCKRGHPMSGDNLRLLVRAGRVERVCRECVRIRNREAKRRKREGR